MDYDRIITFWLKDIPYFWGKFDNYPHTSEKSYFRTYILKGDDDVKKVTNFFDDLETLKDINIYKKCQDYIKNYFNRVYRKEIILDLKLTLRINGNDIHLPLYYSKRSFSIERLYSFLGVEFPKKIILGKYPLVKKYLPHPTITIPVYATSKKDILANEKYIEELIDVYIGIYSELDFIFKNKGYIPISNPKYIHPPTTKAILQNSLFVTLDIRNGEIYSFNKKELLEKAFIHPNIKFIFIPFIVTNLIYTHAKLLIIDKRRENIYIFDPFGKENKFPGSIEKYFNNISNDLGISSNYKLINEEEFCPINSFQYFEESEILFSSSPRVIGGYCSIWVFWFINFLLRNPKINYKNAHYLALNELSKNSKGFQDFIGRYHNNLSNISKKIIKELGLKDIREYSNKSFMNVIREYIYKIYLAEKYKLG